MKQREMRLPDRLAAYKNRWQGFCTKGRACQHMLRRLAMLKILFTPFSVDTIVKEEEVIRLAWWLRGLFGYKRSYPYEETVVDRAWGVQVVYSMFRWTYGGLFHFGGGIDDVRLGPVFGLSGREASLHALRRTQLESWQRTSYDDPPEVVIREHREIVVGLVERARRRARAMLSETPISPRSLWVIGFLCLSAPLQGAESNRVTP